MANSRAGKARIIVGTSILLYGGNQTTFIPITGGVVYGTTEAVTDYAVPFAITLKSVNFTSLTNTKNGQTNIIVRDDGADASTLAITASTTGEFSQTMTTVIAKDSLINWEWDTAASSSGNLEGVSILTYQ